MPASDLTPAVTRRNPTRAFKTLRSGGHASALPEVSPPELPRRVLGPGLVDAHGEPVMGLALGHPRRPLLVVLGATLGTLAKRGGDA
jgi:hypothetical protein